MEGQPDRIGRTPILHQKGSLNDEGGGLATAQQNKPGNLEV